ncbi:MAG: hypothetical protein OEX22_02665 [Cyclobacteriaceae bacterium]|nr:hypothetical protein [Cyclobacteriaceae bacterium]
MASAPEIAYYTAAKEYNAINTSALGTIITHSVKDYAAWMDIYESVEDLRINDGLIDHLILKSLSDENVVTVIGSSLSASNFNKFMANPDLKLAMEEAGVTSKPIVKILL